MVEMKATAKKLSTQGVEPLFLYGFILFEVENCLKSWYNRLLCVHIHYSRTINLMSATWIIWMYMARTQLRRLNVQEPFCVSTLFFFQFERNHDWIMLQTTKLNLLFSISLARSRPFGFSIACLVAQFSSFVQHCLAHTYVCIGYWGG